MENVEGRIWDLAAEGTFGTGELLEVQNDSDDGKGAQFMSEIMFFRLKSMNDGSMKEQTIFIKVQLKDEQRTKDFSTDIQFANEVAMYGTILPELGAFKLEVAPKMLFGNSTNGEDIEKDIIIMEDLRASDYRIANDLFLDYDHVVLTMRKLGEYHGLSYKMKQESPKKFDECCKMLRSRNFKLADGFFEGALYRGFEPNINNTVAEDAHKKLRDILFHGNGKNINHPDEPFAIITHGDFNKNNLMYKYDEDGKVVNVKFIDFANSLYSDPAVDMSFFLYMNTSDELRRTHWDVFLEVYWDGVTSICDPGFSNEEFLRHFAKRAIWGYLPCCFFLPMMMFPELLTEKDNKGPTREEKYIFGLTSGGEEATVAVSAIIKHLLDEGYLEEFAHNF